MPITSAAASRFATVAERARGCVFACDYTNPTRVMTSPGFVDYSYAGSPPFISSKGALFSAATDRIRHRFEEFNHMFLGSSKPYSGVAEINRLTYVPGTRGMILFTGFNSIPGFAFGFSGDDPPKLTCGFNVNWYVSTVVFPLQAAPGIPTGNCVVGFSLNTSGVLTFYVNGVQLGATVAGVTTPTIGLLDITTTTGNDSATAAPLEGYVRWSRWFASELSAREHARYAGVSA